MQYAACTDLDVPGDLGRRMTWFGSKLKALGFDTYDAYLKSQHWTETRAQYRESGREICCYCCASEETIQFHHKTYERLGAELLDDLVPLCARCHAMVHVLERRGDIGIDLVGLLDATRAAMYAPAAQERAAKAKKEFEDSKRRDHWAVWKRVRAIEDRAKDGDSEAQRHIWLIKQKCDSAERRRARVRKAKAA